MMVFKPHDIQLEGFLQVTVVHGSPQSPPQKRDMKDRGIRVLGTELSGEWGGLF